MHIPILVIIDSMRKYMREKNLTQAQFGLFIEKENGKHLTGSTISNILTGRNHPNSKTRAAIVAFLQDEGVLSRLGIPRDMMGQPPVVGAVPTEAEMLEKITGAKPFTGITNGNPDMDKTQSDYEKAQLIGTIVSSTLLNDNGKRRALGQVFPDIFRTLGSY